SPSCGAISSTNSYPLSDMFMISGTFSASLPPSDLRLGATWGYRTGQPLRRNCSSKGVMLFTASQPIWPQLVENSAMASSKGFGVVPTVLYWTSMINRAGRRPIPEGRPNPAEAYLSRSSLLMIPSQGRMRVLLACVDTPHDCNIVLLRSEE